MWEQITIFIILGSIFPVSYFIIFLAIKILCTFRVRMKNNIKVGTNPKDDIVECRICGGEIVGNIAYCPRCGTRRGADRMKRLKKTVCAGCGIEIASGEVYCGSCVTQNDSCTSCGAALREGAKFCVKCGKRR